jgi:High potential iron-sulfur protein
MIMNENITRRALVKGGLIAGVLAPAAIFSISPSASAASAAVDPNDPAAKALGFVTKSTKPDQKCGICNQFQGKAGDSEGPCTIFAGKTVVATGWCMSWVKKSA